MLVSTSLLVLGVFFLIFIVSDIRAYKERKVEDMIGLAQVIGSNNISTLQFQDDEEARKILRELHNVNPQIVYSAILDKQGRLFADYKKLASDSFSIPFQLTKENYLFSGDDLYVTNEIIDGNETIGKVLLKVRLTELTALKRSKYRSATLLLLAALGFSFLIALAVQNYISKRLVHLADTMKEVKQTGDYNKPIPDDGKDEISTLIRGYNDLMQQVQENQQRKDEFISIASHELKTPLTTIKGYMELLSLAENKEPNQQFVSESVRECK
jgi:methyl-accepting chemotaxis protein